MGRASHNTCAPNCLSEGSLWDVLHTIHVRLTGLYTEFGTDRDIANNRSPAPSLQLRKANKWGGG